MKAITIGCRTKGRKSLIELQIFNGASPIKFNQGTNVCHQKESGNAIVYTIYAVGSIVMIYSALRFNAALFKTKLVIISTEIIFASQENVAQSGNELYFSSLDFYLKCFPDKEQ